MRTIITGFCALLMVSLQVTTAQAAGLPDFTVTAISLNPQTPADGAAFTATITVVNQGAAGNADYLYVYTNQPAGVAFKTRSTRYRYIGMMAAGESRVITITGLRSGPEGGRTFRALVNARGITAESVLVNNQAALAHTVAKKPDITVSSISFDPLLPATGAVFSARVVLKNTGQVAATNFHVSAWLDMAAAATNNTGEAAGADIVSLAAGQSVTNVFSGLDGGLVTSSRTLRVFADSTLVWDELSEANNQLAAVYRPAARPDYSVTSIVLEPAVPQCGKTFSATVTVTNSGGAAGGACYMYIYTNKLLTAATMAAGDGAVLVRALGAGHGARYVFRGLPAGDVGAKMLRAFVDARGIVAEAVETNNQAVLAYSVIRKPDVRVSGITIDPLVPLSGGRFSALVTVKNEGVVVASNVFVSVWADKAAVATNSAGSDAGQGFGNIAAGRSVSRMFVNLDAGTGRVARVFRALADPDNMLDEGDESNNQLARTYGTTPLPDFSVVGISIVPPVPVYGSNFTAFITVTNAGFLAGDAGYLYVYTDRPAAVAAGSPPDGSVHVGFLNPGEGKTFSIGGFPADRMGDHVFRAFVDAQGRVAELSETNNQVTQIYTITRKAELQIVGITFNPAAPFRGGTFDATVTVLNNGWNVASNVFVSAWANMSAVASNSAGADAGVNIGTIPVGGRLSYVITNMVTGTGSAKRVFRAFVNSNMSVDEETLANNQLTKSYVPVSLPDFVILNLSLSTTNPPAGSNFTANVTLKNTGYAAGYAGYLDVWLDKSTNVVAAPALTGDKHQLVGTLATNQVKVVTFTGLNAGTNLMPKVFRALVDSRAVTREISETNNQATVDYTVGP